MLTLQSYSYYSLFQAGLITETVNELVAGLTGFLGGVGAGLVEFLEVIFWDPSALAGTGSLTTFGLVIILFMGIGVAYWIIGQVMSLIRS